MIAQTSWNALSGKRGIHINWCHQAYTKPWYHKLQLKYSRNTSSEYFQVVMQNLPDHVWYPLIRQLELTLNLLRTSHMNPQLYTDAYLNRALYFNCTPMTPPGTQVLIFEGPTKHHTLVQNGAEWWYLGTALDQYQCYTIYLPYPCADGIIKTVEFFLHDSPVSKNPPPNLHAKK